MPRQLSPSIGRCDWGGQPCGPFPLVPCCRPRCCPYYDNYCYYYYNYYYYYYY